MTTSTLTYTNLGPLRVRASLGDSTNVPSAASLPTETFTTANCDSPVFRLDTSTLNYTFEGSSDPIQLQVRFPDETSHFTAYYDEKAHQIVFPNKPPVQDPEDFLIAK